MDSAARCLFALFKLKYRYYYTTTLARTMSTGEDGRTSQQSNQCPDAKVAPGSDPDSDIELVWSEIETVTAGQRRFVSADNKASRREKARHFLRTTHSVTISPQRNRFRVTDLRGRVTAAISPPPPEQAVPILPSDIPLPKDSSSKACLGVPEEMKRVTSPTKEGGSVVRRTWSNAATTSAFLSAKARAVLQEVKRQSSSRSSSATGGGGGGSSCSKTVVTATAQVVTQSREMNRLEQVRSWVSTGLGQRLADEPDCWVNYFQIAL